MICGSIYASRENGYRLYSMSRRFPEQYLTEVEEICQKICSPKNDKMADREQLRFSPLSGNKYLLSVIFREQSGTQYSVRMHNIIVNYLMDGENADELFSDSSMQNWMSSVIEKAREHSKVSSSSPVPAMRSWNIWEGQRPDVKLQPQLEKALLRGAVYLPGQGQVIIASDALRMSVNSLLCGLFLQIPHALRKTVSFHTGIMNAQEGTGVALAFCTISVLTAMRSNNFDGGGRSIHSFYWNEEFYDYDTRPAEFLNVLLNAGAELRKYVSSVAGNTVDWEQYCILLDTMKRCKQYGLQDELGAEEYFNNVGADIFNSQMAAQDWFSEEDRQVIQNCTFSKTRQKKAQEELLPAEYSSCEPLGNKESVMTNKSTTLQQKTMENCKRQKLIAVRLGTVLAVLIVAVVTFILNFRTTLNTQLDAQVIVSVSAIRSGVLMLVMLACGVIIGYVLCNVRRSTRKNK